MIFPDLNWIVYAYDSASSRTGVSVSIPHAILSDLLSRIFLFMLRPKILTLCH